MTHFGIGRWLAGFAAIVLAVPAFADSQARIVRLSDVEGNVRIDRRTGDGYESALENLPITQGTRLMTMEDGRAEIEFEDGSTVRLAPNAEVEFTRLSLHDSGGKSTEVDVTSGTVYFNLGLGKTDDFTVDLGHRAVNLAQSARFRVTVDPVQAHVAVSRGQLDVTAPGSETVTVSKNRTANFDLSNQDTFAVVHGYAEDPYDEWSDSLDQYHARNSTRSRVDSPYAYGFSDLNYYGSYINDPGLGSCWRPYFAGVGWDPFADGTWVWYPGFGYTWVSAYPWGWAPYRYGSWNFLNASGWCWQPGAWNQWTPVPRFAHAPIGWKPIIPPADGHGRVPRIRGTTPVASNGLSMRFGDPTRRVVREGPDGKVFVSNRGEAGLGVPRSEMNLRRLPEPPVPGSRTFVNYGEGRGIRIPSGTGGSSGSRSSGSHSSPAPAPAPAPSRSPSPAPAPRGGKG